MKQSGKVSCLTSLLFALSAFSAVASDVAAPAAPPSVKNESVKPEVQTDSETNQDLVPEHPIQAQHFIVNVEKSDDYVISIMIDAEIRRSAKSSDTLSGFVSIYNNDTGVLLNKIELSSSVGDNTFYEVDNYFQGPLLTFNIPKKGKYLIVPDIKTRGDKLNSYSFYFSRAIPTKSFFN